jgi:hypothetical protein
MQLVKNVVTRNKDRINALRELVGELKTAFYEYKEQSFWEILATQLDKFVVGAEPN